SDVASAYCIWNSAKFQEALFTAVLIFTSFLKCSHLESTNMLASICIQAALTLRGINI
ncbi:hypothetical protein X975_12233, partial [Stegodyphus mimosarum]